MDNQEFDDIIKGKLENFQDTGSYDEGALDNLLDNLPNAGGGAAGGLPTWMQSAWWPIGIAASVLFNMILIMLVWNQRQVVQDLQQEIKSIKTRSSVKDTVVISKTDTVFINNTGTSSGYNNQQAGLWTRSPYIYYPNNTNTKFGTGNGLPQTNRYSLNTYRTNQPNQRFKSGGGYNPSGNPNGLGEIKHTDNPQNTNKNDDKNLNGLSDVSGNSAPIVIKNRPLSMEKKRLLASLVTDSIQLLSSITNDLQADEWQVKMKKLPQKKPKVKTRTKNAFWNNIGLQLGVAAGVSTPLIDLGETELAIPLGIKAEISLGERFRLHTGVDFYTFNQEISGLPSNQNNTERFPDLNTGEELKEIKTSANVLDIPIQLRYTFGTRFSNIKPYVGVGLLARRMSLQVSYEYDEDDANALFVQNTSWQLSHYQGVVGAEFFLQRNINLQVNAYYNGGFEALGGSTNYFNNLGFQAGLFFTLK